MSARVCLVCGAPGERVFYRDDLCACDVHGSDVFTLCIELNDLAVVWAERSRPLREAARAKFYARVHEAFGPHFLATVVAAS